VYLHGVVYTLWTRERANIEKICRGAQGHTLFGGAQGHTLFGDGALGCTGTHAFLGDAEGHTLFRSYLSADTSNRGLSLEIGKNRIRFAFLGDIP